MEGFTIILVMGFVVLFSVVGGTTYFLNENIEQQKIDILEKFESFKPLSCTEKQEYLLNEKYTNQQRDYYLVECGSVPIGDWRK